MYVIVSCEREVRAFVMIFYNKRELHNNRNYTHTQNTNEKVIVTHNTVFTHTQL